MAKRVDITVLDAALNNIKNSVTQYAVCSAEPTTFVEANTTFKLASAVLAPADLVVSNGSGGGNTPRKLTVAAKSTTVTTSGTATHLALLDITNSIVKEVTTCTSQGLTATNPLNLPSFNIEIAAPV